MVLRRIQHLQRSQSQTTLSTWGLLHEIGSIEFHKYVRNITSANILPLIYEVAVLRQKFRL